MNVESFFPGRLRVRSEMFTKPAVADRITTYIHSVHGVKNVSVNARTGSLTVVYDATVITMPMLMEAKDELERLAREGA